MSTMDRLIISVPDWWKDQLAEKCDQYGLSMASAIRFAVARAWDLQPPERESEDQGDGEHDARQ